MSALDLDLPVLASGDQDDRATLLSDFQPIAGRLGGFTIDVAASAQNTKCERFYDLAADGLAQSWAGERVWCNPPYSSIEPWVRKAWTEMGAEVVAMLIPANRTEQPFWQDLIEPYRDRPGSRLRTEFLRTRLRFHSPGQTRQTGTPPFGCVLLVWQAIGPESPADLFGATA